MNCGDYYLRNKKTWWIVVLIDMTTISEEKIYTDSSEQTKDYYLGKKKLDR